MKISFFKAIINPFGTIGDNLKDFFKVSLIFASVLTVVGYCLGATYACFYTEEASSFYYCSPMGYGFFLYQIIKFFLFAVFIKNWVNLAFEKTGLDFKPQKQDLKIFALIIAFSLICFLPFVSIYFLYIRVPNPDWTIELLYFSFVSIGFVIPFLSLRFLPIFGFLSLDKKLPPFKEIWNKIKGNHFKLVLFAFILILLFVFLLNSFNQSFLNIKESLNIFNVLLVDFIYNITLLLVLAIFINHCIILTYFIEGDIEK
ncbi:MAG: hypothetical protein R3Y43_03005 [Alphaproteobacteria bacterium]